MFSSKVTIKIIKNLLLMRDVLSPSSNPMDEMKIDRPGEDCQLTGRASEQHYNAD